VQSTVIDARTRGGRQLTIVYATHLLTAADLVDPATATGELIPEPRDEHNRPLRLIYGFASPNTWISEPAEADLSAARETALTTYRRFLTDEERVSVVSSHQYPLRSRTIDPPTPVPVPQEGTVGPGRPARLAGAAVVVAGLAVIAVAISVWPRSPVPVPPVCPSVTTVASQSSGPASPSISPSSTC